GSIEWTAVTVWRHHLVRLEQQSGIGPVEPADVTQTHRAHGVAVITAGERKKLRSRATTRAAGEFVSELEGRFHRGRTVVGEEDLGQFAIFDFQFTRL